VSVVSPAGLRASSRLAGSHDVGKIGIPLDSRIIFVCDAFHAMTSDRPYRARLTDEAAVQELRDHAGTQFDPAVVAAFLAAWPLHDTALQGAHTTARAAR